MLHSQAAGGRPKPLGCLRFLIRNSFEQVGPLDDDDPFPYLWRNGIGHMMALAYGQVAKPALGIHGLADVQQATTLT